MRKAELKVGGDYAVAHHTYSPEAAIIRVTDLGPRTVVRAKVLDPGGPATPLRWRKGQVVEVSLQRITCAADEWSAVAAERKARAAEADAESERRQQEAWVEAAADPTRTLPESYTGISRIAADGDYVELIGSTVRRSWARPASLEGLKALLPAPVLRDLAAASLVVAVGVRHRDLTSERLSSLGPGTAVAAVYAQAAELVERRLVAYPDTGPPLWRIQDQADADQRFVDSCCDTLSARGGALTLPFVPRVRTMQGRGELTSKRPAMGWLRLAYGHTSGRRHHSPGCHVLRGGRTQAVDADTGPMWRFLIDPEGACGVCGGPAQVVSDELIAFRVAADVWHARGGEPEQWQIQALQHLLARTNADRARMNEPDVTMLARVVDQLSAELPGQEGWEAYRLLHPFAGPVPSDAASVSAAQSLAFHRLSLLSEALPPAMRPESPASVPAADEEAVSEPSSTVSHALAEWRVSLGQALQEDIDLIVLDMLIFGLPGGSRF